MSAPHREGRSDRDVYAVLDLGPAIWCPGWDLNPHSPCGEKDFKSFASADFATRARSKTRLPASHSGRPGRSPFYFFFIRV